MARLFEPLTLRGVTLRNRIGVSPMCQYSSEDGFASDWHLVHLGSRAVGGAGLVMAEATAISPEGRISPNDLGLWKDDHIPMLARVAAFVRSAGAVAAIQLAHAGRKASTPRPWDGRTPLTPEQGGWNVVAPSPVPFHEDGPTPRALEIAEIDAILSDFARAANRALEAGFELVELHAAHGYLAHEFLSPLTNKRTDAYGGSFDNRCRFVVEAARAIRSVWPDRLPVAARLSCVDRAPGGLTLEDSIDLARRLRDEGVDLVDASSGGAVPDATTTSGPGFQVPFAEAIRRRAGVATAAVGLITRAEQAEAILERGQADIVLLARELLRDPYWPIHAAEALREGRSPIPMPYRRAF